MEEKFNSQLILPSQGSVVSGQQVGILGGPLYVLFKIMGVIKLAKEKNLQPIYWLETNDSDFDEIKKLNYYKNKIKSFSWQLNSRGQTIGSLIIDKRLVLEIKNYLSDLPNTLYSRTIKEVILDNFKTGTSLGKANKILLQWIFSDYPINFFDPQNQKFITYSQSLLQKELGRTKEGEQVNGFVLIGSQRKAIFKKNGNFFSRSGEKINTNSATLVPNFKIRSLLQDDYLNTKFYVAGPSEEIYLSTLKPDYKFHNIFPSTVVPRMKATLITKQMTKLFSSLSLKKLNLEHLTQEPILNIKHRFLMEKGFDLLKTKREFLQLKNHWVDKYDLNSKEEKQLFYNIKQYLGRQRSNLNQSHNKTLVLLKKLSDQLYPTKLDPALGIKQERFYSMVDWLNQYGKSLIQKIDQEYEFIEKIIYL